MTEAIQARRFASQLARQSFRRIHRTSAVCLCKQVRCWIGVLDVVSFVFFVLAPSKVSSPIIIFLFRFSLSCSFLFFFCSSFFGLLFGLVGPLAFFLSAR